MFPVGSIMTKEVVTARPDMPIIEALHLLTRHKISGMPVVNSSGLVVGVLSEKDLLRILLEKNVDEDHKVEEYMSREVICFHEDDDAREVCKFFMRTHIRRVPIVRDGILMGVVSRRDIITLISEAKINLSPMRYV
ncbi:MAG: CBS domain-containing protein [Candidatus Omnitrophota bacterium]